MGKAKIVEKLRRVENDRRQNERVTSPLLADLGIENALRADLVAALEAEGLL